MSFTYVDPASIEFGICRGPFNNGESIMVPVDASVQELLVEMVENTRNGMGLNTPGVRLDRYEPSQEHSVDSRLMLPLRNPLANGLRAFFGAENRPVDAGAMVQPQEITAYFCIIHDQQNIKLVAIRRASQFKAVLKARLIQLIDDTLRAVTDSVFKLDFDFDLLLVDETVYIHRVAAFELLADIDEQVQVAAVENTRQLEETLPFLSVDEIVLYVGSHKRAARMVAALRARDDLSGISVTNLKRECKRSGVLVRSVHGKLCPEPGHELAFLQMLDRRRYALSLVSGKWEQYEASSRKDVGVRIRQGASRTVPARRARRAGG
jgi:hypothetical protein